MARTCPMHVRSMSQPYQVRKDDILVTQPSSTRTLSRANFPIPISLAEMGPKSLPALFTQISAWAALIWNKVAGRPFCQLIALDDCIVPVGSRDNLAGYLSKAIHAMGYRLSIRVPG